MWERERQVVRTYTTWRWLWLMGPSIALMMVGGAIGSYSQRGESDAVFPAIFFGIGFPAFLGAQWFVAVAKWQFANPRARLTPGYTGPHLHVIGAILAVVLVANPLIQAACMGISPVGPLAFALLLGGTTLIGIHANRAAFMAPAMIAFFSGMFPQTSFYWVTTGSGYLALHAVLAVAGAGMTVWWVWRLANLQEEDDGYAVMALGYPGGLSRLEGEIQRKWMGRAASRAGIGQMLSDRWHDRLLDWPSGAAVSRGLFDYGWGRYPRVLQAAFVCVALVLYALFLSQLLVFSDEGALRNTGFMLCFFVLALPGYVAAASMHGRRARLSQELLRPVSRTGFLDGLLGSIAKQALLLWLGGMAAVWIVALSDPAAGDWLPWLTAFTIWSLALQIPAAAIGLQLARLRSPFPLFAGFIAVFAFIGGALGAQDTAQSTGYFGVVEFGTLGPIPSALVVAGCLVAIGLPLAAWARGSWLRAELG